MMKQKRTFVTLVLVVALLCLGIAYAAIDADTLTINGKATAAVADGKVNVVFTKATVADDSNPDTEAATTGDKTATFTVAGLTTVGDEQTVTFDVENQTANGVPVTLQTPDFVCGNTEWYEVVDCSYDKTDLAAYDTESDDDDTATLTVTVKLLKTVSTDDSKTDANTNNTVTITLKADAADN